MPILSLKKKNPQSSLEFGLLNVTLVKGNRNMATVYLLDGIKTGGGETKI